MENKPKTIRELREKVGFRFPKGFAEANYDQETYLHNIMTDIEKKNEKLKDGIKEFVNKHFRSGSKADREDYVTVVPVKDIWELKVLLEEQEV